jgi:replicative DNA helicase
MADEAVIKRIPPHDTVSEQAVIGSMIYNNDTIDEACEIISSDDFYNRQFGIIFETIKELHEEGIAVDIVTLQNRLKTKDLPPEASDVGTLADIMNSVPSSININEYVTAVYQKSMLRRLIKVADSISNDCYMGREKLEDIMGKTEKQVFDLIQSRHTRNEQSMRTIVLNVMQAIETAYTKTGTVTGTPTGFYDLDYKTAGLQNSDLILVAARPSMGKTAFALNIAHNISVKQHKSVVLFSLEMSSEQIVRRLLSQESLVDAQKMRSGDLENQDWQDLVDGGRTLGEANLTIEDTPGISVSELRSRCRKLKLEGKADVIMIDYLQLMSGSGKNESRQQEISEISRSLKALARELNVPLIALSQLSRAVESRDDKRPMLSDLRESGAIEQDADVVMFLYRDEYYHKDTEEPGITEVIISKQRNGPTGTVKLAWQGQYTRFVNLER